MAGKSKRHSKGKTAKKAGGHSKKRLSAKSAHSKSTKTLTRKTMSKPTRKNATIKVTAPLKKSQLYSHLAECTQLTRKDIANVFDALSEVTQSHLKKGAPGEFTVPSLMKIKIIHKPATKARKGINPFTGQETTFKARPARNVVKVRPLKALKEMAN
ncbi:MAG: DNA-binding protein [uncultured bacterium]|nr:MAG: DNA-binding protein [uncultured bacterium]